MYGRTYFFCKANSSLPANRHGLASKKACMQASASRCYASYTSHCIASMHCSSCMVAYLNECKGIHGLHIVAGLYISHLLKGLETLVHNINTCMCQPSRAHFDVCTEKHCYIRISCMRGCASAAPFACVAHVSCVTESRHMYMYDSSSAYVRTLSWHIHRDAHTHVFASRAHSVPFAGMQKNRRRHTLFFSAIQPSCTGTISARALTCISLITLTDIHMRVRPQACMHARMCVGVCPSLHASRYIYVDAYLTLPLYQAHFSTVIPIRFRHQRRSVGCVVYEPD